MNVWGKLGISSNMSDAPFKMSAKFRCDGRRASPASHAPCWASQERSFEGLAEDSSLTLPLLFSLAAGLGYAGSARPRDQGPDFRDKGHCALRVSFGASAWSAERTTHSGRT